MSGEHPRRRYLVVLCCMLVSLMALMAPSVAAQPGAALTDERALELAQQAVVRHIAYHDGIRRFENPSVGGTTMDVAGQKTPVKRVTFIAVNPRVRQELAVYLDAADGQPLRIEGEYTLWEAPQMGPGPVAWVDRASIIRNPRSDTQSVALSDAADDYGWAKELLYNGTPVTVNYIIPTRGAYSHDLFDDPSERWAHITVGQTQRFEGAQGFVPLVCLSYDSSPEDRPLFGMLGRAGVIYADTGLSQAVLATPGEGTQVRLLGRTSLYHHVQAGDAIGYVPLSGLDLDAETERHIAAQQLTGYMEVQPGWEARYTAYQLERKHLYSQYGAVEGWTLAQNAEDSQLAQRYGFEWLTDRDGHRIIHVLPDADDLSEQQAYQLALEAATQKYGFAEKQVKQHSIALYHREEEPHNRVWQMRFWLVRGLKDCSVKLNARGEAIEYWQSDWVNRANDSYDPQAPNPLTPYLAERRSAQPGRDDLTEEAAVDRAMVVFRDAYAPADYRPYRHEAAFYANEQGDKRWWLITFTDEDVHLGRVPFQVVLLMPGGSEAIFTPGYAQAVETELYAAEAYGALAGEKGPFIRWSLEDKMAFHPVTFGLPQEGDITQEEALRIASDVLKALHLPREEMDMLKPYFSFDRPYNHGRWLVDYLTDKQVKAREWVGYSVLIDAVTGEVLNVTTPNTPGNG